MTTKHIKLFDTRNPNCTFTNVPTPEMFKDIPVTVWHKDENGCMHETPIGITSDINSIVYLGYEIYGDAVIFFKGETVNIEFANYEVSGECGEGDSFTIERFNAVIIKEIWNAELNK